MDRKLQPPRAVAPLGRAIALAVVAALGIALPGCADDDADRDAGDPGSADASPASVAALDTVPTPAGVGSGEPNLFAGPTGVYLSWLEPSEDGRHALRFARWEGPGWSEPGTVIDRDGLFVNWADFPSLVAFGDGTLAAHWLEKSGPSTYAYDVRVALSADGGESWGEDLLPHRDGIQAEHGFVSLFPLGDSVGAVWLDGRATPDGEPMTLRFTTIAPDGGLGAEALLDRSTCDCCQTGVAVAESGPVVAYRDRTADEVRDILIARRVEGRWSEGRPVHDDGWTIAACPVNGPAIAADGRRVAVAWFTGAPAAADGGDRAGEDASGPEGDGAEQGDTAGRPSAAPPAGRVLVAFSDDAGATFGPPVRADDGRPVGRVGLVLLDDGAALLSWVERTDGGAEVRLRRVTAPAPPAARPGADAAPAPGPSWALTRTDAARASGFPRMVRDGERLFFAWTEPGDASRVRTATAPAAAFRERDR